MLDQSRKKGEHRIWYNIKQWIKRGSFEILDYISEHVTLVQRMDMVVNVKHAVSISGNWIFGSNNEKDISIGKIIIGYYLFFFRWR